ncbi:hypothetical protein [Edaphobacter flagellatus]|uniref:hypothetical protein n=1 Tax=Edaphobacter flagellatus TaxID=1933044 RepID=UPI0021B3D3C0|nr:hypothetical protein [Edaphobacter flagellatus]
MTTHLNHEQLCDLLIASRESDAYLLASPDIERSREHVAQCAICAGELNTLSQSLLLFRSTAHAWANHAWQNQAIAVHRSAAPASYGSRLIQQFRPALWGAVAAAAVLAIALPLHLQHRLTTTASPRTAVVTPAAQSTAQSDEALLEDINQTLDSSVPTPMQPLANTTASQSSNVQRKN